MINKKIVTVGLLCCFFEIIQGGMNSRELEKNLGKPVHSFVHMIDFHVVERWSYTTELSRLLLVGESSIMEYARYLPIVGEIVPLFSRTMSMIYDNRFENFVQNVGSSSEQELRQAIQDTLLLTGGSSKAYSMSKLLDCLERSLQSKIDLIEYHMKFDCTQESVLAMKKSLACAAGLIACISLTNACIPCDDKKLDSEVSNIEILQILAVLGLIPVSYKILKNGYKLLTKDPRNQYQYLDQYQNLLKFVQDLNVQLKTDGSISFRLDNGRTATAIQKDYGLLGSQHVVHFTEKSA